MSRLPHGFPNEQCASALSCREERDQRRADIEHLAGSLVSKVNECVAAIDEGKWRICVCCSPACQHYQVAAVVVQHHIRLTQLV